MSPIKRLFLMILLTMMWGPSFLFIKLAIQDLPPMTVVLLRVSIAAAILMAILIYTGASLPREVSFWKRMGVMALFSSVLPFCLFCYAEQTIDSALASVLNGTAPMFTAVLAQLFVASDTMNRQKATGVAMSCAGLVLLFSPRLLQGIDGTALGMVAALTASISYAISHVYGKLYVSGLKPYVGPTSQLLASALMLAPIAIYHDQVWTLQMPSLTAMGGVLGLAIFGSACAFILYYKLLAESGPTALSTVACFFPVVGMVLGYVFLDEELTTTGLAASAMILSGVVLVNEVVTLNIFSGGESQIKEQVDD
jgi:drug/metabolite transporter (DMT)-like permease